jgi:multiple sugar transport system permease protein
MKSNSKLKKALKYVLLIFLTAIFLLPVVFMVTSSFMSTEEVSEMLSFNTENFVSFKLIPEDFSLEQYYQVFFRNGEYLSEFWNSVLITIPTVLGQLVVSALAAFVFGKLKFPGRDKIFFVYMILLILPIQVTLVPSYYMYQKIGLLNNVMSIILPGAFSAFGICLLRQNVRYISDSSIEAARVDGASYIRIFFQIILPQIRGGLVALALLTFVDTWGVVEQPLIYFTDKSKYPLSVSLSASSASPEIVFACGVMFMIPALIIYFLGEKDVRSSFSRI